MSELKELPNEAIEEWVLTYLTCRINKNVKETDPIIIVEGMLFYARDALLDQGIEKKDFDLVNQAKTINSLVNILRGQPPINNWNGCLRDRGFPINQLIFP
jgi:hypothetical protein